MKARGDLKTSWKVVYVTTHQTRTISHQRVSVRRCASIRLFAALPSSLSVRSYVQTVESISTVPNWTSPLVEINSPQALTNVPDSLDEQQAYNSEVCPARSQSRTRPT